MFREDGQIGYQRSLKPVKIFADEHPNFKPFLNIMFCIQCSVNINACIEESWRDKTRRPVFSESAQSFSAAEQFQNSKHNNCQITSFRIHSKESWKGINGNIYQFQTERSLFVGYILNLLSITIYGNLQWRDQILAHLFLIKLTSIDESFYFHFHKIIKICTSTSTFTSMF